MLRSIDNQFLNTSIEINVIINFMGTAIMKSFYLYKIDMYIPLSLNFITEPIFNRLHFLLKIIATILSIEHS